MTPTTHSHRPARRLLVSSAAITAATKSCGKQFHGSSFWDYTN